jgi:hypothetical protein
VQLRARRPVTFDSGSLFPLDNRYGGASLTGGDSSVMGTGPQKSAGQSRDYRRPTS